MPGTGDLIKIYIVIGTFFKIYARSIFRKKQASSNRKFRKELNFFILAVCLKKLSIDMDTGIASLMCHAECRYAFIS